MFIQKKKRDRGIIQFFARLLVLRARASELARREVSRERTSERTNEASRRKPVIAR